MGAKRGLRFTEDESSAINSLRLDDGKMSGTETNRDICFHHFKSPKKLGSNSSTWMGRLRERRNKKLIPEPVKQLVDICDTSNYGTASECSRKSLLALSPGENCFCEQQSGVSSLSSSPVNSDGSLDCLLSNEEWDSDSETQVDEHWELCDDPEAGQIYQDLKSKGVWVKLLRNGSVFVFIPRNHPSSCYDFSLQIIKDASYRPHLSLGQVHASQIISLEPHGICFGGTNPAVIFLPLLVEPGPTEVVECVYSNTSLGVKPRWEKLPANQYRISSGRVVITTLHFSLFTVMLRPQPVESRRLIRQRSGGRLRNAAAPGVEIDFPRGSLREDIVASVRVLYEDEAQESNALASPVIMVGPHGYNFEPKEAPVTIRLPVPDYMEITHRFGGKLSVWQSKTSENEPLQWELIDSNIIIEKDPISRLYTAKFPVYHFSFFKILWDILSSSLLEAKMGVSYFYPYISFSMMCQAFMEENADTSRFGLEVICHRSDRKLPEMTNYKHRVGASLKPKLVKPGKILVRLKSQLFEGDVEAGEDPEMVKEEYDFRGRDFEKQYACRFKPGAAVTRGTFGKVVVERSIPGSGNKEPIFEFNLNKTGNETEATPPDCSDRWSIVAIKELAATLRILEDNNWKLLARHIGFTRSEIKSKLQYSADPFLSMMNMYQARGGSPEEFLQALYAVSRELQIGVIGGSPIQGGSQSGSSQGGSSPTGSNHSSQSSNSPARKRGFWASLAPWRMNKEEDSDTSGTQSQLSASRKRSFLEPGTSNNGSKGKTNTSSNKHSGSSSAKRPRKQYSDISETISSSSSATDDEMEEGRGSIRSHRRMVRIPRKKTAEQPNSDDERSTEKCKRDPRAMTDGDLWRVSAFMNNINWRALGRTLGLQESALVNIESSYRTAGCRECAYQMLLEWKGQRPKNCTVGLLFTALTKENMNEVAKKMSSVEFGQES